MFPISASEVTDLKAAQDAGRADVAGWTHGVYLKMADRATHLVYASVGHVLRIKGLKLEGDLRDVTSHLSGGWRESMSVLKDGGKVGFLVHFDRNDGTLNLSSGLAAAALAKTKEYFQLVLADGSGLSFQGLVSLEFDQAARGKLMAMVVIQVSGAVTVIN
jgi:hypothetical protein